MPVIAYQISGEVARVRLDGSFTNKISTNDLKAFDKLLHNTQIRHFEIDLDSISSFDISFIFFMLDFFSKLATQGKSHTLKAQSQIALKIQKMLGEIEVSKSEIVRAKRENLISRILKVGIKRIKYGYALSIDFAVFVGHLLYSLTLALTRPRTIRYNAISYHIYSGVITAMPIIFIVSFIVGGVIAYQGGATLNKMGFLQASVAMTATLTLREIGPFVVALIVAGRSSSSYTAQIGVMKMTEELSAMRTMNFDLFNFIVIPRFIALVVSFPLMVFLSDLVSIFGCMVFLKGGFEISFFDYIVQLKEGVSLNSFWTGIIKAPFYAAVIVIIGCFVGFRVEDNTQSVGEKTTASVVYALFGVILINALFSLIFTELNF